MDFLDKIALPQSHEHLILLKYLLGLTFTLFVPYLAILIGSTVFALVLRRKGEHEGNNVRVKIARDLVNLATLNKSIVFALGIVPLISAVFCYVQILQGSGAFVSVYLLVAFVFFVIGILFLFNFKNSFNLFSIFGYIEKKDYSIEEEDTQESFNEYKQKSRKQYEKSGILSLTFLLLTAVFFFASIELAADSAVWQSDYAFLKTVFTVNTVSYFLYFIAASITITSAVLLFYYYRIKKNISGDSDQFQTARSFAISWGIVSILFQPVFLVLNILFTPESALSGLAFLFILLLLAAILLTASLLYFMMKDPQTNYVVPILILTITAFVFLNIKDQISFATSSKEQLARLEKNFAVYEEEFKSSLGLAAVEISGADIYNGKCIACHRFDQKMTGPPYNEVLPKYEGNKEGLASFILNPEKVNPEYPAMPNQGLKPNEAQAVAEYLLKTYEERQGGGSETSGSGNAVSASDEKIDTNTQ